MLIYLLVLLTILLGFTSFAVDYGAVRLAKLRLQTAVEAATLAGCGGLSISPAEARTRARAVAANNSLALLDSDIEFGTWNTTTYVFTPLTGASESSANAMRITGKLIASRGTDVTLTFIPLLSGKRSIDITASSICTRSSVVEDIVVVQDVSGSFEEEISSARKGDRDLLDSLREMNNGSNFGLVAFTGTAKTLASLKSVNSNYNSLRNAVNSLDVGGSNMPSTSSGTDIAAGIEKAQSVFNAFGATTHSRSMVIVSDGEPTKSWQNAHPGLSSSQLLAVAQQDADEAWADGINVFVVFWNSTNNATSAANLRTLVRGNGVFVNVTDPTKLAEAIGSVVATTRIVK